MTHLRLALLALVLPAAASLAAAPAAETTADRPPNILIIYADDVGYGDLGCYGARAVQTPNLDRLAASGIRFTSGYAAASTCTPSRYSLLTGDYPFRNGDAQVLPGDAALIIDPERPTLASILKARGYTTGLVGKWHLGLGAPGTTADWNGQITPGPHELGFDYSFHMAATGDRTPTVFIEDGRIVDLEASAPVTVSYRGPVGDDPTGISHPGELKVQADAFHSGTIVNGISRIGYMSGGHSARWTDEDLPDVFLRRADAFIRDNRNRPFFLYYATHENHVPRVPHPRFRGTSGLGVRGDAVVQMDWGVGVLMDTLAELGLSENTLVIFSSDNGPVLHDGYDDGAIAHNGDHTPAGPWRGGKYSVWEGGTRVPFIVSWRGTVQPGISSAIVGQVDLLVSLAEIAGADVPVGAGTDGVDVSTALLGQTQQGRELIVEQGVGIRALRWGDWKYIPPGRVGNRLQIGDLRWDPIAEPGALFYLPEDPGEQHDLAPQYPAKAEAMRKRLEAEVKAAPTPRHSG